MADWSEIESALETWVASITGLPIHWRNRPTGYSFTSNGFCLLSISGHKSLGMDSLTYEYSATPVEEEITYAQSGQRQFTFGIQVRTQRQSVDYDSKNYSSLIRNSVTLPLKTTAVWSAVDISFARILSETHVDADIDGREMSVSQLDILVNASALVEDTKTTYFGTIDDATLEIPEGTTVWTGDLPVE